VADICSVNEAKRVLVAARPGSESAGLTKVRLHTHMHTDTDTHKYRDTYVRMYINPEALTQIHTHACSPTQIH